MDLEIAGVQKGSVLPGLICAMKIGFGAWKS